MRDDIEKKFDKEFHDLSHVGCPGDVPCGTVKFDVKKWIDKHCNSRKEVLEMLNKLHNKYLKERTANMNDTRDFLNMLCKMKEEVK